MAQMWQEKNYEKEAKGEGISGDSLKEEDEDKKEAEDDDKIN